MQSNDEELSDYQMIVGELESAIHRNNHSNDVVELTPIDLN